MLTFFEEPIDFFQLLHKIDKNFKLFCKLTVITSMLRDPVYVTVSCAKKAMIVCGVCEMSGIPTLNKVRLKTDS